MQRFRGGLVFKAHRLYALLNARLESNKEEEKKKATSNPTPKCCFWYAPFGFDAPKGAGRTLNPEELSMVRQTLLRIVIYLTPLLGIQPRVG